MTDVATEQEGPTLEEIQERPDYQWAKGIDVISAGLSAHFEEPLDGPLLTDDELDDLLPVDAASTPVSIRLAALRGFSIRDARYPRNHEQQIALALLASANSLQPVSEAQDSDIAVDQARRVEGTGRLIRAVQLGAHRRDIAVSGNPNVPRSHSEARTAHLFTELLSRAEEQPRVLVAERQVLSAALQAVDLDYGIGQRGRYAVDRFKGTAHTMADAAHVVLGAAQEIKEELLEAAKAPSPFTDETLLQKAVARRAEIDNAVDRERFDRRVLKEYAGYLASFNRGELSAEAMYYYRSAFAEQLGVPRREYPGPALDVSDESDRTTWTRDALHLYLHNRLYDPTARLPVSAPAAEVIAEFGDTLLRALRLTELHSRANMTQVLRGQVISIASYSQQPEMAEYVNRIAQQLEGEIRLRRAGAGLKAGVVAVGVAGAVRLWRAQKAEQ